MYLNDIINDIIKLEEYIMNMSRKDYNRLNNSIYNNKIYKNESITKKLIDKLDELKMLRVVDNKGREVIHNVCIYGSPRIILYCLKMYERNNLEINKKDYDNNSAIDYIGMYSISIVMDYILDMYDRLDLEIDVLNGSYMYVFEYICKSFDINIILKCLKLYIKREKFLGEYIKERSLEYLLLNIEDINNDKYKRLIDLISNESM